MTKILVVLDVDENEETAKSKLLLNAQDGPHSIALVSGYIGGLPMQRRSNVEVSTDGVSSSGTVTFSGVPVAAETITVNGVSFAAIAQDAGANQFNIGPDAASTAKNFAAAVNASVTAGVKDFVQATVVAGVVTIEAIVPGVGGDAITLAEAATNVAVSGATLAGGIDGTFTKLSAGK